MEENNLAGNNYEEYKKNLSRSQKKHDDRHRGKGLLACGIFFLLYLLYVLPFRAGNVSEIRGDEIKGGNTYSPRKVYYIDNLHILRAKTDADDGSVYCIAKFSDYEQKEWIISFTPGGDKQLTDWMRSFASYQSRNALSPSVPSGRETSENEPNPTISGYFLLGYLEDLPSAADAFYTVYGRSHAEAEGLTMINLNAEYLCAGYDNYTLRTLFRRGVPLLSFVVCLIGFIYGGILLIKTRPRKAG